MLKFLSGIIEQHSRRRSSDSVALGRSSRQSFFSRLRAKYDAANTTLDNIKHWSRADSLSAAAANSPDVRRILRNRSRYEIVNTARSNLAIAGDRLIATPTAIDSLTVIVTDATR
ncbi:MAG: hypothetical protein ACE361_27530 [Aureliella sp.]